MSLAALTPDLRRGLSFTESGPARWGPRAAAGGLLLALVLAIPAAKDTYAADAIMAVSYALVGLGLNVLVGYTGQISLGQFAFVGAGAMVAANVTESGSAPSDPIRFAFGLLAAVAAGAGIALVLGGVALRISGLYLALVTLVFGAGFTDSILGVPALDGNAAGVKANRPPGLDTNYRLYLLGLLLLAVVFYLDRRISASRAGRAMLSLRENERVAQAFGINVVAFKLFAFAFAGGTAALAGALQVFGVQSFAQNDFTGLTYTNRTLTFAIMVVVGGLGSRTGVLVASASFGITNPILGGLFDLFGAHDYFTSHEQYLVGGIGALLLLVTVIQRPGGLGEVANPVGRWIAGGPLRSTADDLAGGGVVEGSSVRA